MGKDIGVGGGGGEFYVKLRIVVLVYMCLQNVHNT